MGATKIEGAPDLVIEILSPGNDQKEMSYKRHVYESSGVREYWHINPEKQSLSQYTRVDDELRWQRAIGPADTLQSAVLEGFTLELSAIFG